MKRTYREYAAAERAVRACARKAGLPSFRAAAVARRISEHPLHRDHAARLLARAVLLARITDPHVLAAHKLLASVAPGDTAPLESIHIRQLSPGIFGACDSRGQISIDRSSPMFKAAEAGNYWPLALLLHHECFHQRHGSDERRAYYASEKFAEVHCPHLLEAVRATAASALEKGNTSC